jgi:hypothetical protein
MSQTVDSNLAAAFLMLWAFNPGFGDVLYVLDVSCSHHRRLTINAWR